MKKPFSCELNDFKCDKPQNTKDSLSHLKKYNKKNFF